MKFAVFEQIKKSLESVKRYALGEIGNVANATVEAMEEIAGELNHKADKPNYITIVIPTEGWQSDDFDYPNYYDIAVEGITEQDRADILFLPESMKTAAECGFCSITETLTGKIRVRAMTVPKEAITTEIRFNTNCDAINIEGVTMVELQNSLNQKANVSHSHSADDITGGTIDGNVIINGSVAEGKNTEANGRSSHAEGGGCIALKCGSHAEGLQTIAGGQYMLKPISIDTDTKKITFDTTYEGHSTAFSKLKEGTKLHAMNAKYNVHAILFTVVSIDTTNNSIVVEGNFTDYILEQEIVIIDESLNNILNASHAEGDKTTASGDASHAEGYLTKAIGDDSHAEGCSTKAIGADSHAEGDKTTASGYCSHAEGYNTTASGNYSHSEGYGTTAKGQSSHAGGLNVIANDFQTSVGKYNIDTTGGTSSGTSGSVFVIGNGTSDSARSNCFRVQFDGKTYAKGSYSSSGADYAEYFQWLDGNINNEDRTGLFVTLDGEEIRIANPDDNYILGIVSAHPSVVGDVYDDQWKGMYETDIFGREVLEEIDVLAETIEEPDVNNPQNTITKIIKEAHKETVPKLNPNYNSNEKYIPRSQRPEWSAVGLLGKLVVIDDGSCKVNGWCTAGEGGIAVKSEQKTRFKVMARLDSNHIKILML